MKVKTQSKKVNKAWLNQHANDPWVKLAQKEGYRARAAFKLQEIDQTLHLVRPGQCIVDLGCAPGAWCQYLRRRLAPDGAAAGALKGRIIGIDLLPMEPIEGVQFIQGDFGDAQLLAQLQQALAQPMPAVGGAESAEAAPTRAAEAALRPVDLVLSDMAPNLSGIEGVDAARITHLVELALDFARSQLKPEGALVAKVFHGSGYQEQVQAFRAAFRQVKAIKPKASRDKSSETFLIGLGLKA
ncbi:23S rRNA methylase [Serpentinimonas raichei]|uniref:Ribosomal RNA large subunit methyltransferase E n=1 Tax=Serpentinimonas raichei TaxID=1458425 RepID=A0A060NI46_9BURK|nr:RlmE family RNA methyltransferase [Serpentinimonas raichei]BAO80545.1 23S rRNA methylase [Serpentinimonas raichei]